jgi:hypothetical protein
MKLSRLLVLLILTISCSKEEIIYEEIITNYPNSIEVSVTPIQIQHQYASKIILGLDIAVNGAVNFLDNTGSEHLILTPSPSRWSLAESVPLPAMVFKKTGGIWLNPQYFDNINMGMGGRDVFEFGQGGWLWADTGPEITDAPHPMNHLYISKTENQVTSWTQVSKYKSFYHGGSAGDLNYDGLLDVVGINLTPSENPDGERIHTYLQNTDGSFTQKKIIDVTVGTSDCMYSVNPPANCPSFAGSSILVHDVDNDGFPEIIKGSSIRFDTDLIQNSLEIYTDKDKDGIYSMLEFTPLMSYWLDSNFSASQIKPYDFDRDGDDDLFIFFENTRTEGLFSLGILRNKGNGTFEDTGVKFPLPQSAYNAREFELLDFDYDGDLDIVFNLLADWNDQTDDIMNPSTDEVRLSNLILENTNGTFEKSSKDITVKIDNTKTIGFLKAVEINGVVKFIGIQRIQPYSEGNINILEITLNR